MGLQQAFGNKIKKLRITSNLSQVDGAKYSGIERSQIFKIESCSINVTLKTIEN